MYLNLLSPAAERCQSLYGDTVIHALSLHATLMFVALILVPAVSYADTVQEWRCSTDWLSQEQAVARTEWARRCGLLRNTGGPSSAFSSSAAFDSSFQFAKEYRESDTSHSYSGNSLNYSVNYYYARSLYEATPIYTVFQETSGSTSGYWKWSHTALRARALYPTFESSGIPGSGIPLYPHPTNTSDCRLYTDPSGTALWQTRIRRYECSGATPLELSNNQSQDTLQENSIREGSTCFSYYETVANPFYVVAYCEAGCYAPDQRLLFSDGESSISEAVRQGREDLMTLSPDATLEDLRLQQNTVYSYTTETRDSEHVLFEISTATGGLLKVTHEHPVVTAEGRLVQAGSLSVGDELLKRDGTPDRIISVQKRLHFGRVYNVKPTSLDAVSNVLVAQDFLVGSGRFQNEEVEYINRLLFHRGIPVEVMPK